MKERYFIMNSEKNIIIRAFNAYNEFKKEVSKALIEKENTDSLLKLNRYNNRTSLEESKAIIADLRLKQSYEKNLKKQSFWFGLASIIGTGISIMMTMWGFSDTNSIEELFASDDNITFVIVMGFLQLAVWYASFNSEGFKNKMHSLYKILKYTQYFIMGTSIFNNYVYLSSKFNPSTKIQYFSTAVCAIFVDVLTIVFATASNNCRYKLFDDGLKVKESTSILEMLKVKYLYKYKSKLLVEYKNTLQEYNSIIESLEEPAKEVEEPKMIEAPKAIETPKEKGVPTIHKSDKVVERKLLDPVIYKSIRCTIENKDSGDQIKPSMFNMTSREFRKYLNKLKKEGLCVVRGSVTYVA